MSNKLIKIAVVVFFLVKYSTAFSLQQEQGVAEQAQAQVSQEQYHMQSDEPSVAQTNMRKAQTQNSNYDATSHSYNNSGDYNYNDKIRSTRDKSIFQQIKADYYNYYIADQGLLKAGLAIGVAGLAANTGLDQSLHNSWQNHGKSRATDKISGIPNSVKSAPIIYSAVFLGSMALGSRLENPMLYDWSSKCVRTLILGAPQQLVLTKVLGANRPNDDNHTSHWFSGGKRTVSGHAFYGAVPFVVAAKMTDRLPLKFCWYGLSVIPALARINNADHYPSQAFLGWALSYVAATVVDIGDRQNSNLSFQLQHHRNNPYFVVKYTI